MTRLIFIVICIFTANAFSLSAEEIFSWQSKADYPDTAEIHMRTTVSIPGAPTQVVELKLLTRGENQSVTEIRSQVFQWKIVRNGEKIGMIDLRSGKTIPAQNVPAANSVSDIQDKLGSPADYQEPVLEGDLWKLVPKDNSKPMVFFDPSQKRIVRTEMLVEGSGNTITTFEYCVENCTIPGTLSKIEIVTNISGMQASKINIDVLSVRKRTNLSELLFTIPK